MADATSRPTPRQRLTALGYLAGWRLLGALPWSVAWPAFRAGADIVSGSGKGMDMLRRNLTRVVGPENVARELVRDSVRSYARYWLEAFRLPRIVQDDTALAHYMSTGVDGIEHVEAALAQGNGVVLTLPHSGNWDLAGLWLVQDYSTFTTVAERLKPEELFDAFVAYRESLGFEVFPLTGGRRAPYPRLKEVLRDNGIVCLLGERDLRRRGVPVTFFGEETTFPAGPAKLAMETGAALLVAHAWFTDGPEGPGWGLKVDPPIAVDTLEPTVQRLADAFAANIAAHPADWHMLQPLWPSDVPPQPRRHPGAGRG